MTSIYHTCTSLDPDNLPYGDTYRYDGCGPLSAVNEYFGILPKLVFLIFSLEFRNILSTDCRMRKTISVALGNLGCVRRSKMRFFINFFYISITLQCFH